MYKIITSAFFLIAIFLFSCGGDENSEQSAEDLKEQIKNEVKEELEKEKSEEKESKIKKSLQMKDFQMSMAEALDYKGKITLGKAWDDANGENVLLFTEEHKRTKTADGPVQNWYLYAYHYADKGDGFELKRKIQDYELKCDIALAAEFKKESVSITDINSNAIAEITFVYHLGCNGDPSPVPCKLMMLEDGEKFAIRGTTLVRGADFGFERDMGGETKVGGNFKNAPEGFLDFAKNKWEKHYIY